MASETDPRPSSSEKLEHWRQMKKFAQYDPPPIANKQSTPPAVGNRQEHYTYGGKVDLSKSGEVDVFFPTHVIANRDSEGGEGEGEGRQGVVHSGNGLYNPLVLVDAPILECNCEHRDTTGEMMALDDWVWVQREGACRIGGEIE